MESWKFEEENNMKRYALPLAVVLSICGFMVGLFSANIWLALGFLAVGVLSIYFSHP